MANGAAKEMTHKDEGSFVLAKYKAFWDIPSDTFAKQLNSSVAKAM